MMLVSCLPQVGMQVALPQQSASSTPTPISSKSISVRDLHKARHATSSSSPPCLSMPTHKSKSVKNLQTLRQPDSAPSTQIPPEVDNFLINIFTPDSEKLIVAQSLHMASTHTYARLDPKSPVLPAIHSHAIFHEKASTPACPAF